MKKDTKIKIKFKLGWKEATKSEKIIIIAFYALLIALVVYFLNK